MTQEEFVELCAGGSFEEVCDAIESGINPDIPGDMNGHKIPPIFAAASSRNKGAVRALVEHGAKCGDGLSAAVLGRKMDIAKYIVACGGDINSLDSLGNHVIFTARSTGNADLITELVDLGADINAKSSLGYTALTYVAAVSALPGHEDEFDPEVISILMENGADYYDAMMTAIKTSNIELARLLIDGGADVNMIDDDGRGFVMYSVMISADINIPHGDRVEFLRFLLENGADPDLPDPHGRTPLMIAAIDDEVEEGIIDTLLEFGADINLGDNKGLTALMWAVVGVDKEPNLLIPALIRTGGMNAEGWEKWCALAALYTTAKHQTEIGIVKKLIDSGADVNLIDDRGMNALMYALMDGNDEAADLLTEAGAQINFDLT